MLNKKELAGLLGISISMVDKLLHKGMPHIKVGTLVRFDFNEVLDWIKKTYDNR